MQISECEKVKHTLEIRLCQRYEIIMHVVQDGTEEKDNGQIPARLGKEIGRGKPGKGFCRWKAWYFCFRNAIQRTDLIKRGRSRTGDREPRPSPWPKKKCRAE